MFFSKKSNFNIKNCYAFSFNLFLIIKKLITQPFEIKKNTNKNIQIKSNTFSSHFTY